MICWNAAKAVKLKTERNIDITEIANLIETGNIIDIVRVPSQTNHPEQLMFIIVYHDYIHCVPFVTEANGNVFIKTVFPSRKLNAIYNKRSQNA